MNKIKNSLAVAALCLLASGAQALSVPFSWDGGSLNATGALALASYSPTTGSAGFIDVGDTVSGLDFGTVSLVGVGSGTLTIGVTFVDPNASTQSVSGPYEVFSALFVSGGNWTGGSTNFAYSYGGYDGLARLTLNPVDVPLQLGPSFNISGSITNLSQRLSENGGGNIALAEAGTLIMLMFGLAALGYTRRRSA